MSYDYQPDRPPNRLTGIFRNDDDPDKMPPWHDEAEKGTIAAMFYDNAKIPVVLAILRPEHYYRDAHQTLVRTMETLYANGQPVDGITVSNELEKMGRWSDVGGDDYLREIMDSTPHAANAEAHAHIVLEKAQIRELGEIALETRRRIRSNQEIAPDILDDWQSRIDDIRSRSDPQDDEPESAPLPKMALDAFRGLVGDIVACIAPQTEACPEAILLQLLVAAGNIVGPAPHITIGPSKLRCNMYLCLVGATSVGKGMSWDAVEGILRAANPDWTAQPFLSGMTSGEGVITALEGLHGPALAVETEFARTLNNMKREGNSLSSVLRQLAESETARIPTKNRPITIDNAHFSIVAHTPPAEAKSIPSFEVQNGFVRRFLWAHAYIDRTRLLPRGGDFPSIRQALDPHLGSLIRAIDKAAGNVKPYLFDAQAGKLWDEVYRAFLRLRPPTPHGAATAGAAAMTRRLAMIYAILDQSQTIRLPHVQAALAVWQYCDLTAMSLWGDPILDRQIEKLLTGLKQAAAGMSRTEIRRKIFRGHITKEALTSLLNSAQSAGHLMYKPPSTECTNGGLWCPFC